MENLNDALGINQNSVQQAEQKVTSKGAENTLKVFANIILIVGIILSVIFLIAGIVLIGDYEGEIGWPLLIATVPTLLVALVQWAFITVICNISNNLREINRKVK